MARKQYGRWIIEVHTTVAKARTECEVAGDPRFIALSLSRANPRNRVTVRMFSYIRLVYRGGKLITDNVDLRKFYPTATEEQVLHWKV